MAHPPCSNCGIRPGDRSNLLGGGPVCLSCQQVQSQSPDAPFAWSPGPLPDPDPVKQSVAWTLELNGEDVALEDAPSDVLRWYLDHEPGGTIDSRRADKEARQAIIQELKDRGEAAQRL